MAAPANIAERRDSHGARKKSDPSDVHIKRAVNGGFIVTHHYDNSGAGESYQPPKDHAFTSHKEMMAHIHANTGGAKVGKDGGAEVGAGGKPKGVSERAGKDDGQVAPWGGKGGKGATKPGAKTYGAGVD